MKCLLKSLKNDFKHKHRKPERKIVSTVTEFRANSCSWIVYYNILCTISIYLSVKAEEKASIDTNHAGTRKMW